MLNKYLIRYNFSKQLPQGFRYIQNFITQQEQLQLREITGHNRWCQHLRRHQQYYGIKYFHTKYSDSELQNKYSKGHHSIKHFQFIIQKIKQKTQFFEHKESPNQVLVNKYLKQDYLGLHVEDTNAFGDIIMGLSIGSTDYLRLAPAIKQKQWKQTPKQYYQSIDKSQQLNIKLQNRSLYILSGEARFKWRHGIGRALNGKKFKDDDFERISFTFRDVLETRRKVESPNILQKQL